MWPTRPCLASPLRRFHLPLLALLLAAGVLAAPSPASAGKVLDEEVSNLRETAKNLAIAAATKGNSVRGASGQLDTLLRQSDQLICNSWILAFSLSVRRMAVDLGDSPSPEELKAYQAMVNLRDKIVEKCGPITDPDTHAALRGGPGGSADDGDEEAEEAEEPAGRPFVGRKNWNIVDQICWDQCSRQFYAYRRAAREADKRHERWQETRKATTRAKRALDAEKRKLAQYEKAARDHQAEADRTLGRLRRASGTSRDSLVDEAGTSLRDRNTAQAAARRARTAIRGLRKAWKEAQKTEALAGRIAKAADADAGSALAAYQACVKRCYASAASAGESGAARDRLRDNPNAPYTSKADRRKMLERLSEMRRQEEARSAREAARQAQGSQAMLLPTGSRSLHRLPAPSLGTTYSRREHAVVSEPVTSTVASPEAEAVHTDAEMREPKPDRGRGRKPRQPAPEPEPARETTPKPTLRSVQLRPGGVQVERPRTEPAPTGRMIQVRPPVLTIPAGAAGGGR